MDGTEHRRRRAYRDRKVIIAGRIRIMKTYYFWVTLDGQAPMKVAEEGRIASEAKRIVEARFPGARVVFAEGF